MIHNDDILPADAERINGTYNPAKLGRAYYFTSHGEQLRTPRLFSIDKSSTKNFDDNPDKVCGKSFPQKYLNAESLFYFYAFAPTMGTVGDIISLLEVKEERMLLHRCTHTAQKLPETFFMILPAV